MEVTQRLHFVCGSAGRNHGAASAEGGYVYMWGANDKGQLGCGGIDIGSMMEPVSTFNLREWSGTAAEGKQNRAVVSDKLDYFQVRTATRVLVMDTNSKR
jgi:hypothetical protein